MRTAADADRGDELIEIEVQEGTLEPGFAAAGPPLETPDDMPNEPQEKLRDYLKRLDPEDFGRFEP